MAHIGVAASVSVGTLTANCKSNNQSPKLHVIRYFFFFFFLEKDVICYLKKHRIFTISKEYSIIVYLSSELLKHDFSIYIYIGCKFCDIILFH